MSFVNIIAARDTAQFQNISFDTLQICDSSYSTNSFVRKCFFKTFDDALLKKLSDSVKEEYYHHVIERKYFSPSILKQIDKGDSVFMITQYQVIKEYMPDGAWTMAFDFINTKSGYKLFGCNSYGGPICCR